MAERKKVAKGKKVTPQLSEYGLDGFRKRLDRIGRWSVEVGEDELIIVWTRPVDLVDELALRVEFQIVVPVADSYDPDERMFELWESIHRRRKSFLRDLRRKMRSIVVDRPDLDPCEPRLIVRRFGFPDEVLYLVEVVAESGDDEHVVNFEYDSKRGRFKSYWEFM